MPGPRRHTSNETPSAPDTGEVSPTAEPRAGFVAVGRVLGVWGVHGALRIESLTDFPERFAAGAGIWLAGEQRPVEHTHQQRGALVVKLGGIDEPETARLLRGALIELPESELHALEPDEYYQHDLLGLSVGTTSGEDLGQVAELLPTAANDVLVVRGVAGEYLLPFIEDVVRGVDLTARLITVELLPGLEPLPPHTRETSASVNRSRSSARGRRRSRPGC